MVVPYSQGPPPIDSLAYGANKEPCRSSCNSTVAQTPSFDSTVAQTPTVPAFIMRHYISLLTIRGASTICILAIPKFNTFMLTFYNTHREAHP